MDESGNELQRTRKLLFQGNKDVIFAYMEKMSSGQIVAENGFSPTELTA